MNRFREYKNIFIKEEISVKDGKTPVYSVVIKGEKDITVNFVKDEKQENNYVFVCDDKYVRIEIGEVEAESIDEAIELILEAVRIAIEDNKEKLEEEVMCCESILTLFEDYMEE